MNPLELAIWGMFCLAAGMYPIGLILGNSCFPCCGGCSNETCDGFDLNEAFAPKTKPGKMRCNDQYVGNGEFRFYYDFGARGGVPDIFNLLPKKGARVTGEGVDPATRVTHSGWLSYSDTYPQPNWYYRISPVPDSPPACLEFGGQRGLCGPYHTKPDRVDFPLWNSHGNLIRPDDVTYGEDYRRACVRYLCRCYRATGKALEANSDGSAAYPMASDWYEIVSSTEVGGPTWTGESLSVLLSRLPSNPDAQNPTAHANFEEFCLFDLHSPYVVGPGDLRSGNRFCAVWAFVFFGYRRGGSNGRHVNFHMDLFTIYACTRCPQT